MGPRKARGRRPGPGSSCAARPAWPPSSEAAGSGWMVAGGGGGGGATGTAGEGVRRAREWPPDSAAGAPPLTCSRPPAESGAGREETRCSRPPLYSGSIGRGEAYARCRSPASRSGGTGPGAGNALSAIGTEEATNAAGIAVRSGGAPGGRADGPMALQRPEDGRARGAREAGPEEEWRSGRWRLREERATRCEAAPCRGPRSPAAQGRTAGRAGRLCRRRAVTPPLTQEGPLLPSTPLCRRGGRSGPGPTPVPDRRAPRPRVLWK